MGRRRTRYVKETEMGDTLSERLDNRKQSRLKKEAATGVCVKKAKRLAEGLEEFANDEDFQRHPDYVEMFLALVKKTWLAYLNHIHNMGYEKEMGTYERSLIFRNAIQKAVDTINSTVKKLHK